MLRTSIVAGVVAAGLSVLLGASPARAQTIDKLTYLTFSGPVRIPGVTLTAGTYRFHLTDESTTRKVMQVLSHDGSTVYSQFTTINDWRPEATDESTVTFKETRADAPPAIRSLFYGGERDGYEFIYPQTTPFAEAFASTAAVVTAEEAVKPAAPVEEAVVAEAAPAPAAIAETSEVAEPASAPAPAPEPAAAQSNDTKELPKTASSMPATALSGLGAMLLGFAVSALRRRLA